MSNQAAFSSTTPPYCSSIVIVLDWFVLPADSWLCYRCGCSWPPCLPLLQRAYGSWALSGSAVAVMPSGDKRSKGCQGHASVHSVVSGTAGPRSASQLLKTPLPGHVLFFA